VTGYDVMLLVGLAVAVIGVSLMSLPAALILAGLGVAAFAALGYLYGGDSR
jgi:hypothetical protein